MDVVASTSNKWKGGKIIMKYIRTKDKIIKIPFANEEEWKNAKYRFYSSYEEWKRIWFANVKIIKQADTIEELIDEFVYKHFDSYELCSIKTFDIKATLKYFNAEIFGSIWVDDNLIKVAKMNEKGELELL